MTEYCWGQIVIGGLLRAADAERFMRTAEISAEELPLYIQNDGTFLKEDELAVNGQFTDLENLCIELNLPYARESDETFEREPHVVHWAPGMSKPVVMGTEEAAGLAPVRKSPFARFPYNIVSAFIPEYPVLPPFVLESSPQSPEKSNETN